MRVRGWLLLLCFVLAVFNPGTLAVVAASRVGSGVAPSTLVLALLGVRLVVTSVGVAAGLALWHKRTGAVQLAKASLVLSAIEAIGRLSTRVGFSETPPGLRLPVALAVILFNAVWYLYLDKSRRVRATYGLESSSNPKT
jgi:hypothetical protein